MTNPRKGPDHKICGTRVFRPIVADPGGRGHLRGTNEAGYAMVALLLVMTLLALIALEVAPGIRQQSQREREKEAIFRGEEVADAIRAYYINRVNTLRTAGDQALPTSIDQLLEGIPIPGGSKKRQILRVSASRDPLSTSGEWRLIRPRSKELIDFQTSVFAYAGNIPQASTDPQIKQLQGFAVPQVISALGLDGADKAPASEDISASSSGPFIGVSSRSGNNSILYYYGIDRHDQWIFTPLFR